MGAARMDRMPKRRHASASARESESESSQRRARAQRTHSPVNPESTFTRAPVWGTLSPATARHAIPFSPDNAIAAPLPRVMEQARLAIKARAAFRSVPSDLNSYCTVVDETASGLSERCAGPGSVSRLSASAGPEFATLAPRAAAEFCTTHRGAFQLG